MLPHFRNVTTSNSLWEPIYQNLFEVVVDLPAIIRTPDAREILLENATSITLGTTPNINPVEQKFKYSSRAYPGLPQATHIDFNITFNVNQNEKKNIVTWNHLKRWYDLEWNSQTGELHYKKDYIGQISANIHDRTGEVIRRVDFVNCIITNIDGWDLNWGANNGIVQVNASFSADYWNDLYFTTQ